MASICGSLYCGSLAGSFTSLCSLVFCKDSKMHHKFIVNRNYINKYQIICIFLTNKWCLQCLSYLLGEDPLVDFLPEILWVFSMQRRYVHISSRRRTYNNRSNNSYTISFIPGQVRCCGFQHRAVTTFQFQLQYYSLTLNGAVLTYLTEGVRPCWDDERLVGVTGHSFPDHNIKQVSK